MAAPPGFPLPFLSERMSDCRKGSEEEAPRRGLSARGALIAGGANGLLEKGFDMYIRDPFDAERNPQVRGAPFSRPAWGGSRFACREGRCRAP